MVKINYLKAGEVAPYNGYLLDDAETQEIQKDIIRKDYLEKENKSLKLTITYKDMEIDNLEQRNNIYRKENKELKNSKQYSKWVYFGLGVLGTSLAVYGAGQLRR